MKLRTAAWLLALVAWIGNIVMIIVAAFTGFYIPPASPANQINSEKAQAILYAVIPGFLISVAALAVNLARTGRNRTGLVLTGLAVALFLTGLIIALVLPTASGHGSDPWTE